MLYHDLKIMMRCISTIAKGIDLQAPFVMGICLSKLDGFVQQRLSDEEVISGNTSFPVEASPVLDGTSNHEFKLQQQYSEKEDLSTGAAQSSQQIIHIIEKPMKILSKIDLKNELRDEEKICDNFDNKLKGRSLSTGLLHRLRSSTEIHSSVDFRCKSHQESTRGKVVMMTGAHPEESISEGLDTHPCTMSSSTFTKSCRITTHFWNTMTHTSPRKFKGSLIKAKSLAKRISPQRRILSTGQRSHSVDNAQIVHCFSPQQLKLIDVSEDNAKAQYYYKSQTTLAPAMAPFNGKGSSERSELEFQSPPLRGQCRTPIVGPGSPFSIGRASPSFSDSSSDLFELEFLKRDLPYYFSMTDKTL